MYFHTFFYLLRYWAIFNTFSVETFSIVSFQLRSHCWVQVSLHDLILYSGMKEALNQFKSAYLTYFRLPDFHPGPICQTTPPFRFAIFSLDVSPLSLSAPQHSFMVAKTARVCVRMIALVDDDNPVPLISTDFERAARAPCRIRVRVGHLHMTCFATCSYM